jgi:hypothetical protein
MLCQKGSGRSTASIIVGNAEQGLHSRIARRLNARLGAAMGS